MSCMAVKFLHACTASENDKLTKRNILQLSDAVGILHV